MDKQRFLLSLIKIFLALVFLLVVFIFFLPPKAHAQVPLEVLSVNPPTASTSQTVVVAGMAEWATTTANMAYFFPVKQLGTYDPSTIDPNVCYGMVPGNNFFGMATTSITITNIHWNGGYNGPTPPAPNTNDCNVSGRYYLQVLGTFSLTNTPPVAFLAIDYNADDQTIAVVPDYVPPSTETRIVEVWPAHGTTTNNPVEFGVHAYVNANDIGSISGIQISLTNIDQNVLLLGFLSPSQINFLTDFPLGAGDFSYSTTTTVGEGNYRIRACIERTYFGLNFGWAQNLFNTIDECVSHTFVVGTSTFIGSISQNLWNDTQDFLGNSPATSTEALAATCNPLLGFDIRGCLSFMFVPDPGQLAQTMNEARQQFLTRVPWGYATRFVAILSSGATTTLPTLTPPLFLTPDPSSPLYWNIPMDEIIAGSGELLEGITDPINGRNLRQIMRPWVDTTIAVVVVLVIAEDIMAMGRREDSIKK